MLTGVVWQIGHCGLFSHFLGALVFLICNLRAGVIGEFQMCPQAASALCLPVSPITSGMVDGEGKFS